MEIDKSEAAHLVENLVSQFPDLFTGANGTKAIEFTKYLQSDKAIFEEIRHANENASRSEMKLWLSEFI